MEQVRKKKKGHTPFPRWGWLLLLLAGTAAALVLLLRPKPLPELPSAVTYGVLLSHTPSEVATLHVRLRSGDEWTLTQSEAGSVTLEGTDAPLNALRVSEALRAAAVVSYERILTEDPAEYQDMLAEIGLNTPYVAARITYRDGTTADLSIGDEVPGEDIRWFYMTVQGDQRLFALDRGTAEGLAVNRANLLQVEQPVLHGARMDRITLTDADGKAFSWALQGSITDGNAADRWMMVSPVVYPADGTVMQSLRDNLEHLYIGPLVEPATPGNLPAYGLDHPRMTLVVHQQAGKTHSTGTTGVFEMTEHPESTLTLLIGNPRNEVQNYVQYEGGVHIMSRHLIDVLMKMENTDALSHYLLHMDATALSALTVERGGEITRYEIQRTEQVAQNNELVRDALGNVQMVYTVTKNGDPISWSAFAAWYEEMALAEVSGVLKAADLARQSAWHTRIVTEDMWGRRDEITLSDLDRFQDMVTINGVSVFYLMKDGIQTAMPEGA